MYLSTVLPSLRMTCLSLSLSEAAVISTCSHMLAVCGQALKVETTPACQTRSYCTGAELPQAASSTWQVHDPMQLPTDHVQAYAGLAKPRQTS